MVPGATLFWKGSPKTREPTWKSERALEEEMRHIPRDTGLGRVLASEKEEEEGGRHPGEVQEKWFILRHRKEEINSVRYLGTRTRGTPV